MTRNYPDSGPANPASDPGCGDGRAVYLCDGLLVRKCTLAVDPADGVRLYLGEGLGTLPDRVVLVDPGTGHSRLVSVVWRSDGEAGVRFLERGSRYRVLRSTADLARDAGGFARRAS